MARRRRYAHHASEEDQAQITAEALALFRDAPARDLQQLRQLLSEAEIQGGTRTFAEFELQRAGGFHLAPFPLPGGRTLAGFREFIGSVPTPAGGFPEEELFFDPGALADSEPPWPEAGSFPFPFPFPGWTWPWPGGLPPWLQAWSESRNWWMYHHDQHHTGLASGVSNIRSTTVGSLSLRHSVSVSGTVITIPTVVHGKVYVGSCWLGAGWPTCTRSTWPPGPSTWRFPSCSATPPRTARGSAGRRSRGRPGLLHPRCPVSSTAWTRRRSRSCGPWTCASPTRPPTSRRTAGRVLELAARRRRERVHRLRGRGGGSLGLRLLPARRDGPGEMALLHGQVLERVAQQPERHPRLGGRSEPPPPASLPPPTRPPSA